MDKKDIKEGNVVYYNSLVWLVGKRVGMEWLTEYYYNPKTCRELFVNKRSTLSFSLDGLSMATEGQIKHLHSLIVRDGHATHEELKSWIWKKNNTVSESYSIF